MRNMVEKFLKQYGTQLTLRAASGTVRVKGIFLPVNSKSLQSVEKVTMPLGELSRGQYTYIGPANVPVAEGDTLELGGRAYRFCRVEPYYIGEEAVYLWGLCVEKGGADAWGTRS